MGLMGNRALDAAPTDAREPAGVVILLTRLCYTPQPTVCLLGTDVTRD